MSDIDRTIEAVWKIEFTRLVAGIARVTRDIGIAEELAQEALVSALEQWPVSGIPEKPAAWLLTAAKRRAIDGLRRRRLFELKREDILRAPEYRQQLAEAPDQELDESWTRESMTMFCASSLRPVIRWWPSKGASHSPCVSSAVSPPQKSRAPFWFLKRLWVSVSSAPKEHCPKPAFPLKLPRGEELRTRVESVLSVIYLIFNEGYTATSGREWMRVSLCNEALRLGRILAELMPGASEVHALVALMELQASRHAARRGPRGQAVLLPDQNRSLWDYSQIRRTIASFRRAQHLGGGAGNYASQAAIVACHATAITAAETDWERIVILYDALRQINSSPVVELNRAVAVGMAQSPADGLSALEHIAIDPAVKSYHLLHSVRGDMRMKLGRFAEARQEIELAIALTQNNSEKQLLMKRLMRCSGENIGDPA